MPWTSSRLRHSLSSKSVKFPRFFRFRIRFNSTLEIYSLTNS
ncbi:hypothetical protein LINPERHAP2_LOCUS31077 [Linum perenne]